MPAAKRVSIRSVVQSQEEPASPPAAVVTRVSPAPVQAPAAAAPVLSQPERKEAMQASTEQSPKEELGRIKTGFTLRKDLLKAIKRLAVEEETDINTLLEEGMRLLLESRETA